MTATNVIQLSLLCISSSLDNFAIGVAYSVSDRRISYACNFIMAALNAITMSVTMLFSSRILTFISSSSASTIGYSIFVALGLKDLVSTFLESRNSGSITSPRYDQAADATTKKKKKKKKKHKAKRSTVSKYITTSETIMIGLGLCFTNIAGGIAAALTGYAIVDSTLGALVASFILLELGQLIGSCFGEIIPESYLGLVSGVALVALGITGIFSPD